MPTAALRNRNVVEDFMRLVSAAIFAVKDPFNFVLQPETEL